MVGFGSLQRALVVATISACALALSVRSASAVVVCQKGNKVKVRLLECKSSETELFELDQTGPTANTDVAALELPLASREGFVRQVLGWREFVRHVHEATDGFRRLPDGSEPPQDDAGAACPSFLGADRALPPAFWGARSGLACLDGVVADVWREAWSHHITRLMVLANLATLLDVLPRALTDWFWVAYLDAYDWVVEPNVLGMGTFALGDLFTTKPYVSGAAYLDRMSDFCGGCRFSPKRDCPVTPLYWAFLARHRKRLAGNPRLILPLRSLAKRSPEQRAADARVFERVSEALAVGKELAP
jgi:deoxyribodipyrimidine photolyase-related protein